MKFNNKSTRGPERRVPAMSVMVGVALCVFIFLITIWVLSAPAPETGSEYANSLDKVAAKGKSTIEQETIKGGDTDISESGDRVDILSEPAKPGETSDEPGKPYETVGGSEKPEDESEKLEDEVPEEEDVRQRGEQNEDGLDLGEEAKVFDEEPAQGDKAELSIEKEEAHTSTLITQAKESKEEKIQEVIRDEGTVDEDIVNEKKEEENVAPETEEEKRETLGGLERVEMTDAGKYDWKVCSWDGAQDYIPCLDNKKAVRELESTKHFEHRERHCPVGRDLPTCLVPLPEGYKSRVDWPESRNQVWHANVPHDKLVTYKQDQNWVKKQGDLLVFPGGGTQFKHGATKYIDSIQKTWPDLTWGKHVRTVLDVGCGVASFGGYMFDKDVLTMSFAPKDEHEAQVQMALERGIPGILSVMGTMRLIFPGNSYDAVHCARCRVPWHVEGGKLLLELNRVLRPGGYFVWSATPVYRLKDPVEVDLWKATLKVTEMMCWKLLVRTKADAETGIGMAIFQKPTDNTCYDARKTDDPPMCPVDDKADAAWYVKMNSCLHRIPAGNGVRATTWPAYWPVRLETTPTWLSSVPLGLYGKPASEEFVVDTKHWQRVVEKSYFVSLGIDWAHIRNVMDMKAGYGGFAAALSSQPLWVMNVIPTNEPDTLPIVYDRGLFGVYHDWCESFSTYPRTYDLLHADRFFDSSKKRCRLLDTLVEMDRILRPNGWVIFREKVEVMGEVQEIIESLHWVVKYTYDEGTERLLAARKGAWRPS